MLLHANRLFVLEVLDQEPHSDSCGPLGRAGARLFAPGGSGDIQMCPAGSADELLQEPSGRDSAAVAGSAGILQVGYVALHCFAVFIPEGKLPEPLTAALSGLFQALQQALVATHHAARL